MQVNICDDCRIRHTCTKSPACGNVSVIECYKYKPKDLTDSGSNLKCHTLGSDSH